MSSIFKKIKSAFIIEDAEGNSSSGQSDEAKEKEAGDSAPLAEEVDSSMITTNEGPIVGKVSEKFTHILLKALESHNQEGFDYIEFKRALQNLEKMQGVDPAKTYEIAFATARTMGATSTGLISSAERYLTVLKKEQEKFNLTLEDQKKKQIGTKVEELRDVKELIKQKEARIKELAAEIEAHKSSLSGLQEELDSAAYKIESTSKDFVESYANLVGQIRRDVDNIKKYLN